MILPWMFASVLFALLVGAAARATESAARLMSWQGRAPWIAAIAASVIWPVLVPLLAARRIVRLAPVIVGGGVVHDAAARLSSLPTGVSARLDAVLAVCWLLASLALIARLIRIQRTLARIAASARPSSMDGHAVLVTDAVGPAVVGVATPRIAVPAWLTELDAPMRSLVLRHEREHCRARDTALLWLGEIAVALVPWNPAVRWQARRLRLALELDCDARTLHGSETATTYGKLLLLIAQRQHMTRLAPMLAESNSHLQERIHAMTNIKGSNRTLKAAVLGAVAVVVIVAACSEGVGSDLVGPQPAGGKLFSRQATKAPQLQGNDVVYFEYQVEHPVMAVPGSASPVYPGILKLAGVEGETLTSFVVDTTGLADVTSLKIIKTTHQLFANAVAAALPNMRFTAALVGGRKVKQLVMQPFMFQIAGGASAQKSHEAAVVRP
jgi:beta-lactamase regulating signal transducer with metallopeptidase domain